MLSAHVYEDSVEAPNWGVSLRKGHHEPLVDLATYERVQTVLKTGVYAPTRKDINQDFPLRGFAA